MPLSESTIPRPGDSLVATVAALLDHAQVPLRSRAVRVLASIISGKDVRAEHLGRIAAYERERLLDQRAVPRLCAALKPDATPLVPLVWCAGTWRLGRRIRTDDVALAWSAQGALVCCTVAAEYSAGDNEVLRELTNEFVSEALGPIFASELRTESDWEVVAQEMRRQLQGPGVAQLSAQQLRAEAALAGDKQASAVTLYFGTAAPPAEESAQAFRHLAAVTREDATGERLIDLLRARTGDEARAGELAAFIAGLYLLSRNAQTPIKAERYAEASGLGATELRRLLERWRATVPEHSQPEHLAFRLSRTGRDDLYSLYNARIEVTRSGSDATTLIDALVGAMWLSANERWVVDHPSFQRLRRLYLYGNASLVYPAATTTRFEHGLRSAHIASRIHEALLANASASPLPLDVDLVREAALLHDVAHSPFASALSHLDDTLAHLSVKRLDHLLGGSRSPRESECLASVRRWQAKSSPRARLARSVVEIARVSNSLLEASAAGLAHHGVSGPSAQWLQALTVLDRKGGEVDVGLELRSSRSRRRTELVEELLHLHNAEAVVRERLERHPVVTAANAMVARAVELWIGISAEPDARGRDALWRMTVRHGDSGLLETLASLAEHTPVGGGRGVDRTAAAVKAATLAHDVLGRQLYQVVATVAWPHFGRRQHRWRTAVRSLEAELVDGSGVDVPEHLLLWWQPEQPLAFSKTLVRDGDYRAEFSTFWQRESPDYPLPRLSGRLVVLAHPTVDGGRRDRVLNELRRRVDPALVQQHEPS